MDTYKKKPTHEERMRDLLCTLRGNCIEKNNAAEQLEKMASDLVPSEWTGVPTVFPSNWPWPYVNAMDLKIAQLATDLEDLTDLVYSIGGGSGDSTICCAENARKITVLDNAVSEIQEIIKQIDAGTYPALVEAVKEVVREVKVLINGQELELTTFLQSLQDCCTTLTNTVNGLGSKMTAAENAISTLQGTVQTLQGTVDGHTTQLTTLQSNVTNLTTKVTTIENKIESGEIGGEVDPELVNTVTQLQTQVTNIQQTLPTDLGNYAGAINQNTSGLAALTLRVAANETCCTTHTTQIADLDARIDELESGDGFDPSNLEAAINSLDARVTTLEAVEVPVIEVVQSKDDITESSPNGIYIIDPSVTARNRASMAAERQRELARARRDLERVKEAAKDEIRLII